MIFGTNYDRLICEKILYFKYIIISKLKNMYELGVWCIIRGRRVNLVERARFPASECYWHREIASAQSRRHAINAISIRIRALPPAISCSRLDLKPDRNSSFYRGDSFPPARAKQTATLLLWYARRIRKPRLYAYLRFPRSRKSDVYYRACPAISILSRRRFCFVLLLSESATLGQGTSVLHFWIVRLWRDEDEFKEHYSLSKNSCELCKLFVSHLRESPVSNLATWFNRRRKKWD